MFTDLLDRVKKKTGIKYVIRSAEDIIYIGTEPMQMSVFTKLTVAKMQYLPQVIFQWKTLLQK